MGEEGHVCVRGGGGARVCVIWERVGVISLNQAIEVGPTTNSKLAGVGLRRNTVIYDLFEPNCLTPEVTIVDMHARRSESTNYPRTAVNKPKTVFSAPSRLIYCNCSANFCHELPVGVCERIGPQYPLLIVRGDK